MQGKLLESAHDVGREFSVMSALGATQSVPVPRMLGLCTDQSVVGTPFYLMSFVDGLVFLDPTLPSLPPAHRTAVYRCAAEALARLHSLRPEAVGLAAFGGPSKGENYAARQARENRAARGNEALGHQPPRIASAGCG